MLFTYTSLLALLPTIILAIPTSLTRRYTRDNSANSQSPAAAWAAANSATTEWTIHPSCNNSEVIQLRKHLDDVATVAEHAIDHILRFGNSSELFVKWFGTAPTAAPIGWYERLLGAERGSFQFRCDDPDSFCGPPGEFLSDLVV
jgi:hypothetical protein